MDAGRISSGARFKNEWSGYRMPCKPPRRRRSRRSSTPTSRAVTHQAVSHRAVSAGPELPESSVRNGDGVSDCSTGPICRAKELHGRGQTSRRNAVTAVGVRLTEAPGAPTRREVHIRIPSVKPRGTRWRVAFGDIHLSGDIQITRLVRHPSQARSRPSAMPGRARFADCTTSGKRSLSGDLRSWKDAL